MFNIVNQSKYLNFQANQSFYVELGDYYSWQAQEARKNEWLFRTYWECENTIRHGGYVYWDTLSYDNEHLPHIQDYFNKYHFKHWRLPIRDVEGNIVEEGRMVPFELSDSMNFSCFSHEDYRNFICQLREELKRKGYDAVHNLKYFMVCEYGSDKVYRDERGRERKGTSRPHYHIIFFINNPSIDAYEFSRLVSKCWHRGRTDGLPFKTRSYVTTHNVIRAGAMMRDNSRVRKVCNYIAKYVNKDGDWRKLIEDRLEKVFNLIYEDDFWKDERLVDKYNKLVREIDIFHRQSHGFGEYALEAYDEDEIRDMLDTGLMTMPDDYKGEHGKRLPIPHYYQMKMFWQQYRDKNNMLRWKRTELGSEYGFRAFHRNWKKQKVKMYEWYNNLSSILAFCEDVDLKDVNVVRKKISDLLDGRTLDDLVDYRMIYKGRIRSRYSLNTGNIDDPRQMLYNRYYFDPEQLDEGDFMYNYATKPDKRYFGKRFIINRDLGDKTRGYDYIYGKYDASIEAYTGKDVSDAIGYMTPFLFGMVYCYNQYTHEKFRNFDDLIALIDKINEGYYKARQKAWEEKQAMKKRYKEMGLTPKNI